MTAAAARHGGDRGFTLVEVSVALLAAGLLGGALATLISSQSRFQARTDDAVLARQTSRAVVDVMLTELSAASATDILLATSDSILLRFDLTRAVVCDTVAGGGADLFVFDSVPAANVPASFRGTAVSGPYAAAFTHADGFAPTAAPSAAAEATCLARGTDPGTASRRAFRRTAGWTGGFGGAPERGSIVRSYGLLSWTLDRSGSGPGTLAIRRNGQEFATISAGGARLEYVLRGGAVAPRVSPANLPDIREIRFHASAGIGGAASPARTLVYEVPIRN